MTPQDPTNSGRPKVRRLTIVLICAAVLVTVYSLLAWGGSPRAAQGPLVAVRNANGGYDVEGEVTQPFFLAHAGDCTSKSNIHTSSYSVESLDAWLIGDSIVIINESDHTLMQGVGLSLFERLQATKRFSSIRYQPHAEALATGSDLPDIYVVLELVEIAEDDSLFTRTIKTHVRATISNSRYSSTTSTNTDFTAARVAFSVTADVDYEATNRGFESDSAIYQSDLSNVAGKIEGALTAHLDKAKLGTGVAANMPRDLYPPYKAPPEFAFLKSLAAVEKVNGSSFMQHTSAIWTYDLSDGDGQEPYAEILKELVDNGWTKPRSVNRNDVHLQRGAKSIELFPRIPDFKWAKRTKKGATRTYCVAYIDAMTKADKEVAVEAILSRPQSQQTLAQIAPVLHRHQDLVTEYFTKHPPRGERLLLLQAKWQIKAKQLDAAKANILQAHALRKITHRQVMSSSKLKKLAKEAGITTLPTTIDSDLLAAVGVIKIYESDPDPLNIVAGEDIILMTATTEHHDSFTILSLRPTTTDAKSLSWNRKDLKLMRDSGVSFTTRTMQCDQDGKCTILRQGQAAIVISTTRADGDGLFSVTIKRTKR